MLNFKTVQVFLFVYITFWAWRNNFFISKTFTKMYNSFPTFIKILCLLLVLGTFFINTSNTEAVGFLRTGTMPDIQQWFKTLLNTIQLQWNQLWPERHDESWWPATCLYRSQHGLSCPTIQRSIRPLTKKNHTFSKHLHVPITSSRCTEMITKYCWKNLNKSGNMFFS
jgi:hypothetical protein